MEKITTLLFGRYSLIAWITFLIAVELDVVSLMAGVVAYWMDEVATKEKIQRGNCYEKFFIVCI